MATKFKQNDIVWAKIHNKPWWPALITNDKLKGKEFSVLFIGDSVQVDLPEESLKPYEENLHIFKRTKNTKVLSAILAAKKLRAGEGCIDDEWAKADALEQVENDKKVLNDYLKIQKNNGDSNRRSTRNGRHGKSEMHDEDDDISDDKLLKKIKKSYDPSEYSFSESDFSSRSEHKVTLNLEFFNQLCSNLGARIDHIEDSKLVISSNVKPTWINTSQRDEKIMREVSNVLIEENENKLQLYLANFIMKLQNPKILIIDDKDADLIKIEKLVLSFDLDVFDSTSLIKSNFIKMMQALEIVMEKNINKLAPLPKQFTLKKISSFLRKVKQKILVEAMDCTQFLNAFKIFDSLEANQIFTNLINSSKQSNTVPSPHVSGRTNSNRDNPTVISLISDDSGEE